MDVLLLKTVLLNAVIRIGDTVFVPRMESGRGTERNGDVRVCLCECVSVRPTIRCSVII